MQVKQESKGSANAKNIEIIRMAVADLGPGVAYMTLEELECFVDPLDKLQSSLFAVDAALSSNKAGTKPVTGVCVLEIDYADLRVANPKQLHGFTDSDCNVVGGSLSFYRIPGGRPRIVFYSSKPYLPFLVTIRAGDDYVMRSLAVDKYKLPPLDIHEKYKLTISPLPFKSVPYELVPYFERLRTAMHEANVRSISDVMDFEEAHLKLVREQERVKKLSKELDAEKLKSARLDKSLAAVTKQLNNLKADVVHFLRTCGKAMTELREANRATDP
ncbi:hypothetical protein AAVH_09364 [Aphelenchoides avenae]|nr:hypothetical protein AAVH_09364 [Aphelenchus avenae]